MRQINKKLLIFKSLVYRLLIIGIQIGFTYLFVRDTALSIKISLSWNLLNMIIYYFYDYTFLSIFKIGKK